MTTLKDQTDTAIDTAEAGANAEWKRACMTAIRSACTRWDKFTSEDINDLLDGTGVHTREPRAMGAMMRKAQYEGLCVPTSEFIPSHRTKSNSYSKRVWQSTYS